MGPSDTIVAFDLHSVLFKPDWKLVTKLLLEYKHTLKIFTCVLNIKFVIKSFTLLFNDPTDEEFFALFERYCPTLVPLAIDLMNAHRPSPGAVALVKELKNRGCDVHIMSNIGPRRFETLCVRFPAIMGLFSAAKINNGNAGALLKKPHPRFFAEYLRDCNPTGKNVVLIDDNKHNIREARRHGIVGIRYCCPCHVRAELVCRGLFA